MLKIALEKALFDEVRSERFTLPLYFKDDVQACVAAFWGGAVTLAYQKFDEQTRTEINDEFLASIKQYKNDNGYAVPGEFVIAEGIKLRQSS